jgi:hypothetical protein
MYSPSLESGKFAKQPAPEDNPLTPEQWREQAGELLDQNSMENELFALGGGAVLTPGLMQAVPTIAATGSRLNELARLGLGGARFLGAPALAYTIADTGYDIVDGVFDHIEEESDKAKQKQRDNYKKREEVMPGVVGVNDNPLVVEKSVTMEFTPMPMEEFMPQKEEEDFESRLLELENLEPFK